MPTIIIAYIATLVIMGILDALWFSVALKRLYRPAIGHLMAAKPNIPAAILFYLTYAAGLTYLIILPALHSDLPDQALIRGAALGFLAYATYDFTSLAILRDWPLAVTIIDLAWGTILTAITATAAVLIARLLP